MRTEAEMAKHSDHVMDWLRDAYAAERQSETMLNGFAGRIKNYPELKARIEEHLIETRRQAELVRGCLERLGGDTSSIKTAGGKLLGFGQAISGIFMEDEVMKGVIASYAFEAMEIASYRILIHAAHAIGDKETTTICETILAEEQAMAKWIEDRIPETTQLFLSLELTPGVTPKR
jgi:ferritin-like metal-binding protein YciE